MRTFAGSAAGLARLRERPQPTRAFCILWWIILGGAIATHVPGERGSGATTAVVSCPHKERRREV